ncbi:MAG: glutamate mutase L [Chloroflexi bacterium]|nr:glutamate mutase L [Chloroflexota bacterium]
MSVALLIDFGSTYTKVTAIDLLEERFIGRVQSPSTVDTDVTRGLFRAIQLLKDQTGLQEAQVSLRLACSSAAGGLRMVAVGFIGRLTAEAANRAALGAGAKVVAVTERQLNWRSIRELEQASPDIILLAGGVDGGNYDVILHNAREIAASTAKAPVVVAGNTEVTAQVCETFRRAGQPSYACGNVMPTLNTLNVEPARKVIQEVFIRHIVKAKGLDQAARYVGSVVMPTPLAVLTMVELLAKGAEGEPGLGDTVVMDIGGATTDVHSACTGEPADPTIPMIGLAEPFAKRTVEGDLGLRVSALSLMETAHRNRVILPEAITSALGNSEAQVRAEYLSSHTSALPHTLQEQEMDRAMASAASWMAMDRHAGSIVYDEATGGTAQMGKDLTGVKAVIGTGGVFTFGAAPHAPLSACLYDLANPSSLRPVKPEVYVDSHYVMYACGLLATVHPAKALRVMKRSLVAARTPTPTPD